MQRLRQAATPDRQVELTEIINDFAAQVRLKARDHGRTPMPWDASKRYAGFSDASDDTPPWTPMNSDFDLCNVAHQEGLSNSVLKFWRKMLAFRHRHTDALVFGDFTPVCIDNSPIFAYHRTPLLDSEMKAACMLVVLNLTKHDDVAFVMPAADDGALAKYTLECARSPGGSECEGKRFNVGEQVELKAYEGLVFTY